MRDKEGERVSPEGRGATHEDVDGFITTFFSLSGLDALQKNFAKPRGFRAVFAKFFVEMRWIENADSPPKGSAAKRKPVLLLIDTRKSMTEAQWQDVYAVSEVKKDKAKIVCRKTDSGLPVLPAVLSPLSLASTSAASRCG